MQKHKINVGIFTYDFMPFIGGQGKHVYELYKQNQIHNKINLYIFSPNNNSYPNHVELIPNKRFNKFRNISFSIFLNNKLNRLIQEHNLDIIHIHGGPGGVFLLKKLEIPTIYTSHHTYWQQYHYISSERWKLIFYYLEKLSYQNADKIICVSRDTLNVLKDKYNISSDKLVYIPNGVETFENITTKKMKTKSPEILYIGRIDKRKGVHFLIETMKIVNQNNPNIILHVVGRGKDKQKLEAFARKNNINVVFHGFLSDVDLNELYQRISIQIVPSIFEGFGLSVLEAMSKRTPVIATNVDGIKDIINNRVNGILIEYGDKDSLAKAITDLLNNPNLQEQLINNGLKSLNLYDWRKIYAETYKLYQNII